MKHDAQFRPKLPAFWMPSGNANKRSRVAYSFSTNRLATLSDASSAMYAQISARSARRFPLFGASG